MLSARSNSVAVIGAGVVGLPIAVMLTQNRFKPEVTLIAEEFSPNIASDAAVATIRITDNKTFNDDPRNMKWIIETYRYASELYASPLASRIDMSMVSSYAIYEGKTEVHPYMRNSVIGFREVGADEKKVLNIPEDENACCYSTFVVSPSPYLAWQMERFKASGGNVVKRKLKSLQEVDGVYDVVVNCTGLGSRELVDDHEVTPTRGQAVLVDAPWLKHSFTVEIGDQVTYMFPRSDGVVLGGTAQIGNCSMEVSVLDRKDIISKCSRYAPSLAQATVIKEWAGIRPGRKQVHLEREVLSNDTTVIHNYGHSGNGFALSIGCAKDVVSLIEDSFAERHLKHRL